MLSHLTTINCVRFSLEVQLYTCNISFQTIQEDPRVFSAMIWTVHFAYDNVGWPSFERAAQMINDTGTMSLNCACIGKVIYLSFDPVHWFVVHNY